MGLLQNLNSQGMTILMITHNPECTQYAYKTLHLSDGLVLEKGEAEAKGRGNALYEKCVLGHCCPN
jgi:ABC-type lipoprotein export system ATPase subunit